MRVLHKTSQSHPDTYLTRPYGSRCYAREKAPVHRSNVPSSVHFPKYCAGFCLQIHQPLFTLNIRVNKVIKGNYRKHNFSKKKKKEFYSLEIGKFRSPASMDSCSKNKNPLLVCLHSTRSFFLSEVLVLTTLQSFL